MIMNEDCLCAVRVDNPEGQLACHNQAQGRSLGQSSGVFFCCEAQLVVDHLLNIGAMVNLWAQPRLVLACGKTSPVRHICYSRNFRMSGKIVHEVGGPSKYVFPSAHKQRTNGTTDTRTVDNKKRPDRRSQTAALWLS